MEAFCGNSKYTHEHKVWDTELPAFVIEQAFPDEVLDLDASVRTLDLTRNKLGNVFLFLKHLSVYIVKY